MRAWQVDGIGASLREVERGRTPLAAGEVRIAVSACAVCRTDLHVIDGEIAGAGAARWPIVPGHEIVGRVIETGSAVATLRPGTRVGVPWLGHACGTCEDCRRGEENLCAQARFTGYQIDGGFATETIAEAEFVFPLPERYGDVEAAPLLCAGLIGWRALRAAGEARRLGLYGFGAAAHLIAQVALQQGRDVLAFTRPGDAAAQRFARDLGAVFAGGSDMDPPVPLDAAILFAPVGALVPRALAAVRRGGVVVCAGIHMSDIPSFRYELLWGERTVRSVANLTRRDAREFLAFAAAHALHVDTHEYRLADVNRALADLRAGRFTGAAVVKP